MTKYIFYLKKTNGGLILTGCVPNSSYSDNKKEEYSEMTIPTEYEGQPIVAIGRDALNALYALRELTISEGIRRIGEHAFANCGNLRSVSLPASMKQIGAEAFRNCGELCDVQFRSYPVFGEGVFSNDFKLPAELILAGQIGSLDFSRPIARKRLKYELLAACEWKFGLPWFTHSGAFALAAQNDCFREISSKLLDYLIEYTIKEKMVEQTAYFLELKKRKFGFDNKEKYDI